VDDRAVREREVQRERLQRTLDELSRRQRNVLRQAQNCEPGDPFERGLRENYNELEAERKATLSGIGQLDAADDAKPDVPIIDDVELLDALPYLALNLGHAPQDLMRKLFEIIQLSVRLDVESDDVTLKITLPADMIPAVAEAAERIEELMPAIHQLPRSEATKRAVAVRAPNGIRTRATALKGRRPGPLDDEGLWLAGRFRGRRDVRSIWDAPGDRQNG
jgi:site-specific DNA recombinase